MRILGGLCAIVMLLAARTLQFAPTSRRIITASHSRASAFPRTAAGRSFVGPFPRQRPSYSSFSLARPTSTASSRSQLGRRFSVGASSSGEPNLMMRNIGFEEMEDLIEDYEEQIREGRDPEVVVMDVRTDPEVQATGRISDSTVTLPLQLILSQNLFARDDDDFEEIAGFPKPPRDATLVFSCAAGIRSVYACQAAAAAGYGRCVNYAGGANEWFSRHRRR